jgi:hypothetical protein
VREPGRLTLSTCIQVGIVAFYQIDALKILQSGKPVELLDGKDRFFKKLAEEKIAHMAS